MQGLGGREQHGQGEAQPHEPVLEEGVHRRARLLAGHGQGHLGYRVDEVLRLHPLAAKDDGHRDHHQVEGGEEGGPAGQGQGPGVPGDGLPFGQPLEEVADRPRVAGRHPLGDVGQDHLGPLVLGGGVVEAEDQDRQVVGHQPGGGQGAGDHHHAVGHHQLAAAQGPGRTQELQGGVEAAGDQEEQDQRRAGGEAAGHPRPTGDHLSELGAEADAQAAGEAEGQGPRAAGRGACGRLAGALAHRIRVIARDQRRPPSSRSTAW